MNKFGAIRTTVLALSALLGPPPWPCSTAGRR